MRARTSYTAGEWHTRYLKCSKCAYEDQQVVRAEMVMRRKKRDGT